MLKRFFTAMLGSIAGFYIALLAMFIVGFICIVALVGNEFGGKDVKISDSVLYIDLSGDILERYQPGEFVDILTSKNQRCDAFDEIITSLRFAANDKDIKGVVINCDGSSLGVASREEIVNAIKQFKKSGKWVYAYADNYNQGDYYVATAADKIYLNPVGAVDVHGLATNILFYKTLLDKLGIEMQVVKVGSFKSAVEPYLRTDMSDSSRLQTRVFLDDIWGCITSEIAENRGVTPSTVNKWADEILACKPARVQLDSKVVTDLAYKHEFEDFIREKLDIKKDEDLPYVSPGDYMSVRADRMGDSDKQHIAVYFATGDIVDSGEGGIVGDKVVPQILDLAQDDNVVGLVLRVNSPGGSAFASEQIWEALETFKQSGKPLYVSMGDYAASGGYYISCGADKIYADNTTLTGSIGIFGVIPNAHNLIVDKIGVNIDRVVTNPNADMLNLWSPMTEEQRNAMQKYVEEGYETFTSRVAEGRGMSQAEVKRIGEGRVWDGMKAIEIGLVDEIGTLTDVIDAMAELTEVSDFCFYPEIEDKFWNTIFNDMDVKVTFDNDPFGFVNMTERLEYNRVMRLLGAGPSIQARMVPMTVE